MVLCSPEDGGDEWVGMWLRCGNVVRFQSLKSLAMLAEAYLDTFLGMVVSYRRLPSQSMNNLTANDLPRHNLVRIFRVIALKL